MHPIRTLATLALATGAFALGLTMGQNTEASRAERAKVEVLVGTGCDGTSAGTVVLMAEEDGFGANCKEIIRKRV